MIGAVIALVIVVKLLRIMCRTLGTVGVLLIRSAETAQKRKARAERLRAAQEKRNEAERLRAEREAERRAAKTERLRAQRCRQEEAEALRTARAEERVREAQIDLDHLALLRSDLLKLYAHAEQLEQDAGTDARKAAALAKRISIDSKIRNVDRRREQLQSVIRLGGR